jgi:hypothetical protein
MANYNDWSKTISSTIRLSKKNPSQGQLHAKAKRLSLKYYGTEDLKALQPYQLDKVITWVTGRNPDAGKNRQRKAQKALHKGKWYKNSNEKRQAILENKNRHLKNST